MQHHLPGFPQNPADMSEKSKALCKLPFLAFRLQFDHTGIEAVLFHQDFRCAFFCDNTI